MQVRKAEDPARLPTQRIPVLFSTRKRMTRVCKLVWGLGNKVRATGRAGLVAPMGQESVPGTRPQAPQTQNNLFLHSPNSLQWEPKSEAEKVAEGSKHWDERGKSMHESLKA